MGRDTLRSLATLKDYVGDVAVSPDGKTLASGSDDNRVRLWDIALGKEKATLLSHTEQVSFVAFSPDGGALASASHDVSSGVMIKLWSTSAAKELGTFVCRGWDILYNRHRFSLFSPDGKTLAAGGGESGSKGVIKLWDVATGKEKITLKGHTSGVRGIAYHPSGKLLTSGSSHGDNTVRLWDVATGKEVSKLDGRDPSDASFAFSPDGKTLASWSVRALELWDVNVGK